MERDQFYVTTPIYYVTAKPHLGSLYATLLADVLARWHKLLGKKIMFVTGTDEHGQKVAQAAQKAGKEPQLFVDEFIPAYKEAWDAYNISNDVLIRTTDKNHVFGAQEFIKTLMQHDAIYRSLYEGWYCTPCETFVTEAPLIVDKGPLCSSCNRETSYLSEQTYFFRLSAYQERLLQFYKDNPDFVIPKERAQEIISFVEGGLKDLSISRTTVSWGVPFPEDSAHTVYVWVEALCNYLTAIGYPSDPEVFATWWPADIQVLGKDIIRFHGVYWPAFLMAVGLPLPKQLLVHGWIKVDKQKMSKSLGNAVDPMELFRHYGADPVRYYLMRRIAVNQDGEFAISDLEQAITSELANDLGNLLQRTITLALKKTPDVSGIVYEIAAPDLWSDIALVLRDDSWDMIAAVEQYMEECMFHLALARIWQFVHKVNAYFHAAQPWKIADSDSKIFTEIISATAHSLHTIAVLLWPVMPTKMEELLNSIGMVWSVETHSLKALELGSWNKTFTLHKREALFNKIEKREEVMPVGESKTEATVHEKKEAHATITIDEFSKVVLLTGTIMTCESVDQSDKLVKMTVDCGSQGMRTILAGVKKYYSAVDLVGKQGVFVFNLKPRKMAGLESHGMMLMAEDENAVPHMVTVATQVPNGTRLK